MSEDRNERTCRRLRWAVVRGTSAAAAPLGKAIGPWRESAAVAMASWMAEAEKTRRSFRRVTFATVEVPEVGPSGTLWPRRCFGG